MAYRRLEQLDDRSDGSCLLPTGDEKAFVDVAPSGKPTNFLTIALVLVITLLLCSNIATMLRIATLKRDQSSISYTGIDALGQEWHIYNTTNDFTSDDQATVSNAWSKYTTNGFVALPHDFVKEKHLPKSRPMPEDPRKGLYVLAGFHQLHCVMYLREAIQDMNDGNFKDDSISHVNHCLDTLRQAITCRADDMPLAFPGPTVLTGHSQPVQCRNWDALTIWANEHTACFPTLHC